MQAQTLESAELGEAWIEGGGDARWRSASAHGTGAAASGSSLLEVDAGCRLPPHTDSAEETIVVVAGRAEVVVDGEPAELGPGIAVVPATYERDVQLDGGRERDSTA